MTSAHLLGKLRSDSAAYNMRSSSLHHELLEAEGDGEHGGVPQSSDTPNTRFPYRINVMVELSVLPQVRVTASSGKALIPISFLVPNKSQKNQMFQRKNVDP